MCRRSFGSLTAHSRVFGIGGFHTSCARNRIFCFIFFCEKIIKIMKLIEEHVKKDSLRLGSNRTVCTGAIFVADWFDPIFSSQNELRNVQSRLDEVQKSSLKKNCLIEVLGIAF